jgi:hypothetical protein
MAAHPGTYVHNADNAVPPLNDDLAGLLEELAGFDVPGLDQIINGFRELNTALLTIQQTQTGLTVLTGSTDQPGQQIDVQALLAATVARLLDAGQNPALRTLPTTVQDQARTAGADFADHDAYITPRTDIAKTVYDLNPL